MAPPTTPAARPALPHPRTFPRETIRAAIEVFADEGRPPSSLTVTQLRMRLGGGSWQTIREELERAQAQDRGGTETVPRSRLGDDVPSALAGQAAALEQLLERAGAELWALVAAVRDHDRRQHEQEVAALRAEIDELRRQLAGFPAPASTKAKRRRRSGGGGAS